MLPPDDPAEGSLSPDDPVEGSLPPDDPAGAQPRRDYRFLARVSRHAVPKTAGEVAKKDIRPRQGVALIRESGNQCDTLAGSLG